MTNPRPILSLLPQQPPFVMVDELTHFDPVVTQTQFEIKPDNLFVEDGCFSAAGVLENIAQTCAARMGHIAQQQQGAIKVGVIGALRNMQLHQLPKVGETLHTTIKVEEEVFEMVLAHATVEVEREGHRVCCAEGNIKIALTDKEV